MMVEFYQITNINTLLFYQYFTLQKISNLLDR